jgi:O-acetyl-ADP-ribose deacetylase (regulator of RNase III)
VVALPALGCGRGELAWDEVRPLMAEAAHGFLVAKRVLIFEPQEARELTDVA